MCMLSVFDVMLFLSSCSSNVRAEAISSSNSFDPTYFDFMLICTILIDHQLNGEPQRNEEVYSDLWVHNPLPRTLYSLQCSSYNFAVKGYIYSSWMLEKTT